MKKPHILVTNDDGYHAPGILKLTALMQELGDVTVVAPEEPMSGVGHAITVRNPLRLQKRSQQNGLEIWSCKGTPVDCVKLGEQIVLRKKPDLVVSGINHGSNAAVNIVYSGTMGAVLESTISGIPSIGFSICDYRHDADFSYVDKYIKQIVREVLEKGLPEQTCLNVNIPAVNGEDIKGMKVCHQANARWVEEYDERKDPANKNYYWLTGKFELLDDRPGTDEWALRQNYISVVPVHYDLTAHHAMEHIKNLDLDV
ncbi:MAG: 5'/3'-nucleotidase SurE [Bacteroidetes bacterium]|nr:5'/3'-nucleotidase SurE [Bacteroidota bacterium]MCK5764402.1 5'/3'-nucleotidase SurE [Bacteroidales bacterium]